MGPAFKLLDETTKRFVITMSADIVVSGDIDGDYEFQVVEADGAYGAYFKVPATNECGFVGCIAFKDGVSVFDGSFLTGTYKGDIPYGGTCGNTPEGVAGYLADLVVTGTPYESPTTNRGGHASTSYSIT